MVHALTVLVDSPVLIVAILISGIGGTFQYGFQISSLNSPSPFIKELINATCLQHHGLSLEHWQLSLIWSFIVSTFCIGGLLGSLCAGRLVATYGRKRCLLLNNLVAMCGAVLMVLSKTAMSFEMILVARLIYGINAGISLPVHTMYLTECAPKRLRGMVGFSVTTFGSMGKFVGQLLGISELLGTEERWIWLLAFSGFTGFLQLLILPFLPESPRFLLLERGDQQGCEKAIHKLWGRRTDHRKEVEEMLVEHAALKGMQNRGVTDLLFDRSMRWQLLTVLVTAVTMQLSGMNAVYLYALDVFRAAGIPEHQLRYASLGTGMCEFCTSIAFVMVVESTGKKMLIVRGYLCMAATLGLLTLTLYLQNYVSWMPYCSMILIFLFIFFISSGPAGVTAPLPGEIFPQSLKAAGFTIACTLNWLGLFLVGMVFPIIVEHLDYFCFLIFLVFCLFAGLFVWRNVPETKNRTVLEITAEFQRIHNPAAPTMDAKADQLEANNNHSSLSTRL
ncbi:solute carrier family 2, facilitated glucose transporter member 11-like [Chanos chanos]|uniref:Solute carrier family 2, facilitated glucose transporter member 5 n=1 Tax=Chanos chanos TaxID=29144 RepID=A0A6J2UY14_CHACN|nr:solute carrier family 2, facilitated glucose transporter member 11-like [Chanos chanos]